MAHGEGIGLPIRLRVDVISASKVIAKDPNGKSDPYCVVYLGHSTEHAHKTEVKPATLEPVWNETFSFQGKSLEPFVTISESTGNIQLSGYLVFDVWDRDTVNLDDFLGRVILPLREITPSVSLGENWYPLTNRTAKDNVSGSLCVRLYLIVDSDKTVVHDKMNADLYQMSKSRGYHLPICSGRTILEFPGTTEHIEMAMSHVFVDASSYHCTAHVYLTNYRLLILSTSNRQGASSSSHGRGSTLDLSMWIALNNIMSVEMGTESFLTQLIRKSRQNTQTMAITINCYDFRTVKLVFVLETKTPKPPVSVSVTGSNSLERKTQPLTFGSPRMGHKLLRFASEKMTSLKDLTRSMSEGPKSKDSMEQKHHPKYIDRRHSTPLESEEFLAPLPRSRSGAVLEKFHQQQHVESVDENLMEFSDSSDEEAYDIDEVSIEFEDFLIHKPSNERALPLSEGGGCGKKDKALNPPRPTAALVQSLFMRLENLVVNVVCYPPAQTFPTLCKDEEFNGWDLYNFPKEMDRQGVSEQKWRLTVVNGPQYELCPTYPQLMYIPASVKDETLIESAKFRSKNRVPCLVWVDAKHQNFMMRCAQPLTGTSGKHSTADEQLIQSALDCGPCDSHMTIFDARSFSAATGNKIMGKGTEDVSHYARTRLTHLDIPNIHAVRESYEALRAICLSTISSKWHSALESTQWLNYISVILKGSTMIARYMKLRQGNALVHCSDGWDRTSQLTSLTQLMMDYYYRTITGFMILIEKEWLSFGHKFQERLGDPACPNERSPIFLQFLDCVHQLINQFPNAFEFTTSLPLCIAEHLNTAWFGTFLCNCDKERHDLVMYARTISLWAHIEAEREKFLNPDYCVSIEPIFPTSNIRRLRLWEDYFLRYDYTAFTQQGKALDQDMADQELLAPVGAREMDSWSADTVVWMSDTGTNECCTCQQKFSAFRRRHHCRACGRIFCHECSKGKIALSHLGYFSPVRVCDECYSKLNKAQQISDTEDGFILVSTND